MDGCAVMNVQDHFEALPPGQGPGARLRLVDAAKLLENPTASHVPISFGRVRHGRSPSRWIVLVGSEMEMMETHCFVKWTLQVYRPAWNVKSPPVPSSRRGIMGLSSSHAIWPHIVSKRGRAPTEAIAPGVNRPDGGLPGAGVFRRRLGAGLDNRSGSILPRDARPFYTQMTRATTRREALKALKALKRVASIRTQASSKA